MLKAKKTFMDGKGRLIQIGDELPTDYSKTDKEHYLKLGMAVETKQVKPKQNK